jgi:hypothetical protein
MNADETYKIGEGMPWLRKTYRICGIKMKDKAEKDASATAR